MLVEMAKQILAVYTWILIGALLFFLWRIAGFYEKASGQRVSHQFVLVPGVLLLGGAALYVRYDVDFVGHPAGDLLLFSGGVLLFLFSSRLARLMTGER
ncbi:MAG: hypothetical protein U9R72_16610 [Chloroflexota bacterium]|nr:hypothetical protein [Chloroflexota bacterium]